jgi:hypothetical protein
LDRPEAELLCKAAGKVARWYAIPTMAQKTIDWTNFAMALNAVYTPRVIAARMRRAAERSPKAQTVRPQTAEPARRAEPQAPSGPNAGLQSARSEAAPRPNGAAKPPGQIDLDDPRMIIPGELNFS